MKPIWNVFLSSFVAGCFFAAPLHLPAQASGTPANLTELNNEFPPQTTADAFAASLVASLMTEELQVPTLSSIVSLYLSSGTPKRITEGQLSGAFGNWLDIIGADRTLQPKTSDIHRYTQFLSHFAPSIFTKTNNGQVGFDLSPTGALYLLDKMITHGGLPSIANSSSSTAPALPVKSASNNYR